MRVFVKDMSGVYLYHTTPRKARILLKQKKATVESNNPFTIRLLFSASECGVRGSKKQEISNSKIELPNNSLNIKPIRENIMCNSTEQDNITSLNEQKRVVEINEAITIPKTTDVSTISAYLNTPSLSIEHFNCFLGKYRMFLKKEDYEYLNKYPYISCDDSIKLRNLYLLYKPEDIKVYFKESNIYKDKNSYTETGIFIFLLIWETESKEEKRCHISFTVYNYHLVKDIMNIFKFIISYMYNIIEYVNIHFFIADFQKESLQEINVIECKNKFCTGLEYFNFIPEDSSNEEKSKVYLYYLNSTYNMQFNYYIQEFKNFLLHKIQEQNHLLIVSSIKKSNSIFNKLEYYGLCCRLENIESILGYDYDNKKYLFEDQINPSYCATAITDFAKKQNKNMIAVIDYLFRNLNNDYLPEEYYRELVKECKNTGISLVYGMSSNTENDIIKIDSTNLFFRFADVVTFLK